MNQELYNRIIKFRDDRDWAQFHTGENLAKSINTAFQTSIEYDGGLANYIGMGPDAIQVKHNWFDDAIGVAILRRFTKKLTRGGIEDGMSNASPHETYVKLSVLQ